ncbi:MAG: hypothetical protein BMS9Abin07_2162 [Acidimicrobiia bacterium]|nr:MAG: hypothetical protein BMS9Abin07_2162 [Acidimicrobiia bacterium]
MRGLLAIVVAVSLGALALIQVEPAAPDGSSPGFAVPTDPGGAIGDQSVWYCPWVESGAVRDSTYDIATAVDVEASITLPNSNPTLEPDTQSFVLRGPDARSVETAELARRGPTPGIVEFDDGPAVVSNAMWTDELLTGDRCVVSVPKVWHLVGGITAEGFTLEMRLFNPFPEAAKVTVEAVSEFGSSPLGGFEGLDVPGRSWVTEDLSRVIPFLDNVTLTVKADTGLVIPALVLNNQIDEASWNGISQSATWNFPVTSVPGLEPTLVLSNTGTLPADVIIDVFEPGGAMLEATSVLVSPQQPLRLFLSDLAVPPFGIRVRSNVPVGAVIQAGPPGTFPRGELGLGPDDDVPANPGEDEGDATEGGDDGLPVTYIGLASTTGTIDPATRWLITGIGVVPAADSSVWLMNASGDQATVTLIPLGATSAGPNKMIVAPGSIVEVQFAEVSETGMTGLIVDATVPISAGLSIAGSRGVAFIAGIPVE